MAPRIGVAHDGVFMIETFDVYSSMEDLEGAKEVLGTATVRQRELFKAFEGN